MWIAGHPLLSICLGNLSGAILMDLAAFKNSKDPGGFFATFSWKIAGWRYLQSFVGGIVGNTVVAGALAGAGAVTGLLIWYW
jgi:hypothetical protein